MGSFSNFFNSFRSKNEKEDSVQFSETSLPVVAPASEFINATPGSDADLSLIAVITAAVAMMLSDGSGPSAPYPGFRVRRIRRLM